MRKEDLRIVFMGTPEFAVESLRRLVDGGYNVVAVVTQPDKAVGRHRSVLKASPVKEFAISRGLPVLQPIKMKDENFLAELKTYRADLQVVVAFRMLPEAVWAMPRFGTFNVHAALLPQYRGAAPINWAIINGETKTGVTTFFLDHDIDTGRIIMQRTFDIPDDADAEFVYEGLMCLGATLCLVTVDEVIRTDGNVKSMPQCEHKGLKPAPKIFNETCRIDWNQSAKRIYDFVRGLTPYPGVWTVMHNEVNAEQKDTVIKIYKTAKADRCSLGVCGSMFVADKHLYINTGDGVLEISELQISGKKRMAAKDFLNGFHHIELYRFV